MRDFAEYDTSDKKKNDTAQQKKNPDREKIKSILNKSWTLNILWLNLVDILRIDKCSFQVKIKLPFTLKSHPRLF